MNIEQLEYIVEVSKTKSISTASTNLLISQSGISRSISNLENELGIKIFHRSRSGTRITTEGEAIVKLAYEVVAKLQQIKEEAQLKTANINGELKISASPSVLMTILLKAIPLFKKDYPGVKLEITERAEDGILDDIRNERTDIGLTLISENIQSSNDLKYGTLLEGKMNVCVNKNSPLAFNQTINPKDILHYPLAMYNGINMKHFFNQFITNHGEMDVLFMSNNMEAVKRAVVEGLAISFIVDLALKDDLYVKNGEIITLLFENIGVTTIPFGWIKLKNEPFTFIEKEFIKCLQAVSSTY